MDDTLINVRCHIWHLQEQAQLLYGRKFPHCCCRGYICVSEWWKNCPAHTKSHLPSPLSVQLRGTGAAGAGARSDSKTGSGKKKNSLRGLVCFLWMDSVPCWLPVHQLQGLHGGAQVCPAQRGAFARLLLSRNTWKSHPKALLMAAELKNPEITGEARTCPIHSLIPWGSLG